jgi:hypothetical protein
MSGEANKEKLRRVVAALAQLAAVVTSFAVPARARAERAQTAHTITYDKYSLKVDGRPPSRGAARRSRWASPWRTT